MIIKEYGNADLFLNEYETELLEMEVSSQLLLCAASQSQNSLADMKELFGAVLDEDKVLLLFAIPNNLELLLYSCDVQTELKAAAALADYLGEKSTILSGLNAKQSLCQSFIDHYKKYHKGTIIQKLGTDIMELRKLNDVKPVIGLQRLATMEDVKLVADWIIQFQIDAMIDEADYEATVLKASQMIARGQVYLYENENNQVVSMAAATRKLVHGMGITYIFTPPEHRGQGYAAANIYYLSKQLLEQGYEFCTLFVDKLNPLTNRAYEKLGYNVIEDNYEYKIIPLESYSPDVLM